MTINDWIEIALDIKDNYNDYDGFVVVHGTDTMAYSVSALSFMLENLGKSVVFTGSQVHFCSYQQKNPPLQVIYHWFGIAMEINYCDASFVVQVPIYEQRNDGRDNLLGALVIAGHYVIPEVSDAKTQNPEIIVRQSFSLHQLPPKVFYQQRVMLEKNL